jgi:hypothetical protein
LLLIIIVVVSFEKSAAAVPIHENFFLPPHIVNCAIESAPRRRGAKEKHSSIECD